ncbi:MAG: hypothetical protein IPG50_12380 [Myxococcales bacterium]|nr:hypothetical protein [Myxococcales bacterium]
MADPEDRAGASPNREGHGSHAGDAGAEEKRVAAGEDVPARPPSRRRWRWLWVACAAAVATMAASVAGGFVWRARAARAIGEDAPRQRDYRFTFLNDPASQDRWFDAPDETPPKFRPERDPESPNGYRLPRTVDEAAKMFVRATDAKYRAVYEKSHWTDYRFIWAARRGNPAFEGRALQYWLERNWLMEGAPLRTQFAQHAIHKVDEMARILVLRLLCEITDKPFDWEWARATAQDGLWVRQTTLPPGSPERLTAYRFGYKEQPDGSR